MIGRNFVRIIFLERIIASNIKIWFRFFWYFQRSQRPNYFMKSYPFLTFAPLVFVGYIIHIW